MGSWSAVGSGPMPCRGTSAVDSSHSFHITHVSRARTNYCVQEVKKEGREAAHWLGCCACPAGTTLTKQRCQGTSSPMYRPRSQAVKQSRLTRRDAVTHLAMPRCRWYPPRSPQKVCPAPAAVPVWAVRTHGEHHVHHMCGSAQGTLDQLSTTAPATGLSSKLMASGIN